MKSEEERNPRHAGTVPACPKSSSVEDVVAAFRADKTELTARRDDRIKFRFAPEDETMEMWTHLRVQVFERADDHFFQKAQSTQSMPLERQALECLILDGEGLVFAIASEAEECLCTLENKMRKAGAVWRGERKKTSDLNAQIRAHNQRIEDFAESAAVDADWLTVAQLDDRGSTCSPFGRDPKSYRARMGRITHARDSAIAGIKRTMATLKAVLDDGAAQ